MSITAFVSNRGGIGKSSLVSQLAPAYALAHPDRDVVVLDMSIQGDTSTFLLGGAAEPRACAPGVRTRGAESLAALAPERSAAAFIDALRAPPPTPSVSRSFWRGLAAAPAPVESWRAHSVRPAEVHPSGGCPPNVHLIPGGKRLFGAPFDGLAPALRRALAGAHVFVDTDAELTERGASLAGIGAADSLAIVLSTSWADYLRTLDDPANSLFAALVFLAGRHPELSPRVAHVVFNGVQKRLGAPSGFESAPGVLPFTPPSLAFESIAEISAHLRSVACDPETGYARFFAVPETLASDAVFVRMYVTAVPAVPDGAWAAALLKGQPLVCSSSGSDGVAAAAAAHIAAAMARFK